MIRRFGLLIFAIGAIGLGVALWADPKDGNEDAWREVSGAVVSGAVLAGLVVWFEDRREAERVDRAEERDDEIQRRTEHRDDEAARRAWRREIDVRLVALVRTDLLAGRLRWLESLEDDTHETDSMAVLSSYASSSAPTGTPFNVSISETDALLSFLREDDLIEAWSNWSDVSDRHDEVPPPPRKPRDNTRGPFQAPQFSTTRPAARDAEAHAVSAELEEKAWGAFTSALDSYVEQQYPI